MREILFRGKVADEPDEWVIGALLRSFGHYEYMIRQYETHAKTKCCGVGTFDVKPETVGQYTGMTDKSGVKIFEGDIVKRFDNGKESFYRIEYDEKFASFIGMSNGIMFTTFDHDGEMFEVVGNFYDNPKLVEQNDD
ncbi:MAG: YopX family protein [Eubacteriales bacterium]